MAKYIAQILILGGQAVGRALARTVRQEFQNAEVASKRASEAGKDGVKSAKANAYTGMQLEEAKQIIGIDSLDDIEAIRKKYEHLFRVNEKAVGGSFYLQSKVVRAKERIELEMDQKVDVEKLSNGTSSNSDSS